MEETAVRRVLLPVHTPAAYFSYRGARVRTIGGDTMGTTWSVRASVMRDSDLEAMRPEIEAELATVIRQMSTWDAASDISRFNVTAPGSRHWLKPEFRQVLAAALSVADLSGGAYDPAAGRLVDLWGFGPSGSRSRLPCPAEIEAALTRSGYRHLRFSRETSSLVRDGTVTLDLSGIAKGFAVDRVAELLKASGFRNILVEIGGELRGEGVKPDGQPWWVLLERPTGAGRYPSTVVALHGLAMATAGSSQKRYTVQGRRYTHIVDPRSGYPIANGIYAVTVFDHSCMMADAHATAMMVLGKDDGLAYGEANDLAAIITVEAGGGQDERWTSAALSMLD
ncbi:MAG: FAD:protein FMN transferase [Hyphomicrobiales bacterium]